MGLSPASSTQLPHKGWCSSGAASSPQPCCHYSSSSLTFCCCSLSGPWPLASDVYSNNFQFFLLMEGKSECSCLFFRTFVGAAAEDKGKKKIPCLQQIKLLCSSCKCPTAVRASLILLSNQSNSEHFQERGV